MFNKFICTSSQNTQMTSQSGYKPLLCEQGAKNETIYIYDNEKLFLQGGKLKA